MILIDTKTLPALAEKDLDSCQVKTSLELKAKNAESWMHTARGNDTLYPVESVSQSVSVDCPTRTQENASIPLGMTECLKANVNYRRLKN